MKTIVAFILLNLTLLISSNLLAQDIKTYNFKELSPLLHKETDTIYLVNFWATWCGPCVKEMPAIEKLADEYKNSPFKVLLISLDMPKQIDSRLIPFIRKHNIKSEVILLNEPDFNSWIDKVEKNWSGAIPASLIYTKDIREFYEQSFTYDELEGLIAPKIKQ